MKIHPAGVIAALHERLPGLLPAHEVLGVPTAEYSDHPAFQDRGLGDYVYVQGRGDRIHAFLGVTSEFDTDTVGKFAACDANWRWLAAWEFDVTEAMREEASELGLGLAAIPRAGPIVRELEAEPNPGIFIKAYPELRRRWRELSSW